MLVGYKELQSAHQYVLPTVNRTKTLFNTEYSIYTVALTKIGNHTVSVTNIEYFLHHLTPTEEIMY